MLSGVAFRQIAPIGGGFPGVLFFHVITIFVYIFLVELPFYQFHFFADQCLNVLNCVWRHLLSPCRLSAVDAFSFA